MGELTPRQNRSTRQSFF